MYIYNVTVNIETDAHESWLLWMQDTHIPDVLATGKFSHARMCRVLVEEETGGFTYSIQYSCPDQATLTRYYDEDAPRLRKEVAKHFGAQLVAFRTELEVVNEQSRSL